LAIVTTPGRAAPLAPRAPEVEAASESAAGLPSAAPARVEARGASPQARLALVWSGYVSEDTSALVFSSVCLDLVFSPSFSKRRQSSIGLAPRKALKTGLASAAGAAVHQVGWLAFAQSALERGPQAARVAMGQVPQTDPSVGAAIVPEETADAAVAPSLPDLLLAPASTPAGAVADSPAELPIAPDVRMVEEPPLVVVPDLPSLGHKERAAVVAEVGDRGPASLAEGRPSTSTTRVPDASTTGGSDASEEGRAEPQPVLGAATLSPRGATPMSGVGRRSGSGATTPQNPSSSSTMSGRSSLGMSSVSMPRQRWGRFGRPWRSFPGMFPGSSR
jgi:hypothetical protein